MATGWEANFSQEEAELAIFYYIVGAGPHLSRRATLKELMSATGGTWRDIIGALVRLYRAGAIDVGYRIPPDTLMATIFFNNTEAFTLTLTQVGRFQFEQLLSLGERRLRAETGTQTKTGVGESGGSRLLRVFLCHATEDKFVVRVLYQRLLRSGVDAWLDERKLLGGMRWKWSIDRALRRTDAVLACISQTSIRKEGFVQKEIRRALEISEEKPDDVVFLIPVRLDNCDVPDSISHFHWIDLFMPGGYDLVIGALQERATKIGVRPPESYGSPPVD